MKDNLKALNEQKAVHEQEMETLLNKVKVEERAFTEEENARFTELENNVKLILDTVKAIEGSRELTEEVKEETKEEEEMDKEERAIEEQKAVATAEERAFENYIRGKVEERADVNLTKTDNGAVIPTTIAGKIIKKVYDISPLLQMSTKYNVKGKLAIPYYTEDGANKITMAYQDEFKALESKSGKFLTVDLDGFLAGALAKVANSLINNTEFDIVNEVIDLMATSISVWVEGELINGSTNKIEGLAKGVKKIITTASATVITADEVIKLKRSVKQAFQKNACFIMSNETLTALSLLKDNNGRYLLQDDLTSDFDYKLLGKPVYESDNMAEIGAGKTAIYYGDMSGLATKMSEQINIQVLREKYADEHATGVIAWTELDAKVEDAQKISKLVCKSA